jgi:hypothetical protein
MLKALSHPNLDPNDLRRNAKPTVLTAPAEDRYTIVPRWIPKVQHSKSSLPTTD